MTRKITTDQNRKLQFEQFEQRIVMTAQAVASLLPEMDIVAPAIIQQEVLEGAQANEASELAAEYGFDGSGQTVAVIDSGIAWDHFALGNGYGEGHKVVGGYDFAENDDNPYDDGPAGFHGTHVAGIIGSTDEQYTGVAPGADLVGLRVFGDNGQGSLDWVEQALQWVHDHKDDFEHPITTVNLSLGTNWNAQELPEWANLEDEFAQLEADGLFISVAAGNGFRNFGETGLSYPAVSEHVVAVGSHDAEGNLSDFSQRDEKILVAPGELNRSTVPDHVFVDGRTNQFLGSSGTSMAAPYLAGASAILRQANEFVGAENIDQELLYQQFRDSADQVYDAVTDAYYHRVNLEAALESVIQDLHSDTFESATDVGAIAGGESISGTIGRLTDVDSFEFTAQTSGRITLDFEVTNDLEPLVEVVGVNSTVVNNRVTFDVVAGQKYEFSVASANGNGHYNIDFLVNSGQSATSNDFGTVISADFFNQRINGESTYSLTSAREGILTIQTQTQLAQNDSLTIEVFDSQMNLLGSAETDANGQTRLDFEVTSNEQLFIKAIGYADSVEFSFDNLVSVADGVLTVRGTDANDVVSVSTTDNFSVDINGIDYEFDHSDVRQVNVIGQGGDDRFDLELGYENDRVASYDNGLSVSNQNFSVRAWGVESTSIDAGSGNDVVSLLDSASQENLTSQETENGFAVTLEGTNRKSTVVGFELVYVGSTGGDDTANLNGTSGDDFYTSRGERNLLRAGGTNLVFNNFASVEVNGGLGNDLANLNASGNDHLVLARNSASLESENLSVAIDGFSRVNAFSTAGTDSVVLEGTVNADIFDYRSERAVLYGEGYFLFAHGFADIDAISNGGTDIAQVFDTAGNDLIFSRAGNTELRSETGSVTTDGFTFVNIVANQGGFDRAEFTGTDGADTLQADRRSVRVVNSNGQSNRIVGAEQSTVDLGKGFDLAYFTGSAGRESFTGSYDEVEFETTLQLLQMTNAEYTHFDGKGGGDEVNVEDLNLVESIGDKARAFLQDRLIEVEDFEILQTQSVDQAIAEYSLEAVDYK